jgi:hypothetical protein
MDEGQGEIPMSSAVGQYNIAAIRNLTEEAFTARDLWRFCQERPVFRPIVADFGFNSQVIGSPAADENVRPGGPP